MRIKIEGQSGCTVETINEQLIRKIARSTDKATRLLRQIEKQSLFYAHNSLGAVFTPKVTKIYELDHELSVEMRFIPARDFIEEIAHSGKKNLDRMIAGILSIIQQNHQRSTKMTVSFDVLDQKFEEVLKNIGKNLILCQRLDLQRVRQVFESLRRPSLQLPIGVCHGDLTMSNMLFSGEKIALIDFLDTFLESPIQDMVKIRQDTRYRWSTFCYRTPFDRSKTNIALDYIDHKLHTTFTQYDYYLEYYAIFQFMNMLRILPYATEVSLEPSLYCFNRFLFEGVNSVL